MNRKLIRALSLLVTVVSIASTVHTKAYADPISDQNTKNEVQDTTVDTQADDSESTDQSGFIQQNGDRATDAHPMYFNPSLTPIIEELQLLDSNISKYTVIVEQNKLKQEQIQLEIQDIQDKIQELIEQQNEEINTTKYRIRELYNGNPYLNYLSIIFDSESLGDFFTRTSMIQKMIEFDGKVFQRLKDQQDEQHRLEEQLTKEEQEIAKLVDTNNKILEDLAIKKAEAEEKRKVAMENAVFMYQDKDAAELSDQLKEKYSNYAFTNFTPHKYPGSDITPDTASPYSPVQDRFILKDNERFTQGDVIMFATSLLGIQYIWGGTDLSGMDCSGFVGYVYRHFGVYLPRVSQDQQFAGTPIKDEADLQPGDLLFYGNPAHHVTMYLCPGYMIEAPQSGDVIKVSKIRPYTSASRIVDWDENNNAIAVNTTNKAWEEGEVEKLLEEYEAVKEPEQLTETGLPEPDQQQLDQKEIDNNV